MAHPHAVTYTLNGHEFWDAWNFPSYIIDEHFGVEWVAKDPGVEGVMEEKYGETDDSSESDQFQIELPVPKGFTLKEYNAVVDRSNNSVTIKSHIQAENTDKTGSNLSYTQIVNLPENCKDETVDSRKIIEDSYAAILITADLNYPELMAIDDTGDSLQMSSDNYGSQNDPGPCVSPHKYERFVNLSSLVLTEDMKKKLENRVKIAVRKTIFPVFTFAKDIDEEIKKRRHAKTRFRLEVIKELQEIDLAFHEKRVEIYTNITPLEGVENVVMTLSDKGNSIVLMDRKDYESKVMEHLEKPGGSFRPDFLTKKRKLETSKEDDCEKLSYKPRSMDETPGAFAKVNLDGSVTRVILNYENHPLSKHAKDVAEFLAKCDPIGWTWFKCLHNTDRLITKLEDFHQFHKEKDYILASVRVNMFEIEFDDVDKVLRWCCDEDETFESDEGQKKKNEILARVRLILESNYCKFGDKFYKQVKGIPTGSPVFLMLATLTTAYLMNIYFIKKYDRCLKYWWNYADSIIFIWSGNENELDTCVSDANDSIMRDKSSIRFELTKEHNKMLDYMELTLIRENSRIEYKVCRDVAYPGKVINYNSASCSEMAKKTIAEILFFRALRYSSNDRYQEEETKYVRSQLTLHCFPGKLIKKAESEARNRYHQFQQIKKISKDYRVIVPRKLVYMINGPGRENRDTAMTGGVYAVPCDCGEWYIGEAQDLKQRLNQHLKKHSNSPFQEHCKSCEESPNKYGVKILDLENDKSLRQFKEKFYIISYKPTMNEKIAINEEWINFLQKHIKIYKTLDDVSHNANLLSQLNL